MTTTVIGLVGLGRIGSLHASNLHAANWASVSGHEVDLVVTDVDPVRTTQIGEALSCRTAADIDDLFAQTPDGVVIATGTAQHAALVLQAVDRGVPVFCEKPLAESTAASLPVLEAIERSQAVVQIGHQRRFDAGYREARRAYRQGELGWLHTIRALTCDVLPPPVEFLTTSGGLFRDCSVHDFDILQWLTGRRIVEVYAKGSNLGDPAITAAGDIDSGVVLATFDDATVATVSATRYNGAGHDVRLELHGSKDTLQVGLDASYAGRSTETGFHYPAGSRHATFHERFAEAYRQEMRGFIELIHGERENPCTAAEAVDAARIADAAQLSLHTGRPERVRR